MSGEGDAAPVEEEYRREEKREQRAMDSNFFCCSNESNQKAIRDRSSKVEMQRKQTTSDWQAWTS